MFVFHNCERGELRKYDNLADLTKTVVTLIRISRVNAVNAVNGKYNNGVIDTTDRNKTDQSREFTIVQPVQRTTIAQKYSEYF